ncbi:MAG TPA: glycosyltransferase family 39 protein, partial [Thermoanaerobaculia bacterium]|nr:glycosyltransferase family 39 protein [Thermoanaerobaculia bacterium]
MTLALLGVLLVAAGLRLWGVTHDLPFSYYGDELHFMKRSMAMGTGDLNPHWFHKPAFLMYVLAFFYGLYFAAGLLTGRFDSTEAFGAHFLFEPGPFLLIGRLVVTAFGVATVYLVYRIGRQAFGRPAAGLAAAFAAAVLVPMVDSSQEIKSDVPCGFLMTLAVYVYMRRSLVLASLLAGMAMGTHYYGIILVPAFIALETWRAFQGQLRWRGLVPRAALVGVLFLLGFFLASPYNLLDPTWARDTFGGTVKKLGLSTETETAAPSQAADGVAPVVDGGGGHVEYEIDTQTAYKPGPAAWAGAAVAFFAVMASPKSMGLALTLLAALGLGSSLARRETRWYGLLVLIPFLFFLLAAVTVAAYHAQPRHLNAIYPLLATLVWPGALLLVAPFRLEPSRTRAVALALAALACVPTLVQSVRHNREITRLDSRLVSYRWLTTHLPRDTRILVDEYGPLLNPNRQAAARLAAQLAALPMKGPFTHHQGLRIQLLQRYPPADGLNMDEFGHQWWLRREQTDAELRGDYVDLDMSNPLVSRQPRPLEVYRAAGYRYIVTNSEARNRYRKEWAQKSFPSFARFYREL